MGVDVIELFLTAGAHDAGNAECAFALFGHDFLHSDSGGWMRWTGKYWAMDGAEAALESAITAMLKQRSKTAFDAEKMAVAVASTPSANNLRNCKTMFRQMVTVGGLTEFDAGADLLNVANGVLNLRTGALTPHDAGQRFTYCLTTPYRPDADYSVWVDFLQETVKDAETLNYLQAAVGYSLTAHTNEEIMFYIWGPSRSGKGTFTETLLALVGAPLSTEADLGTFTAKREGGDQNFDLAPLRPTRLVFASESNTHEALNAARIKRLTGGNYITCAFKFRDQFTYRPCFKIWLSSNHPVRADVDDDAAWGRVRVIEFPNGHLGNEDKSLKQRLKTPDNLAGVLRWAVEGAQAWYGAPGGLKTPLAVTAATQAHRDALDFVQSWIDECARPEPGTWCSNHAVFNSYAAWCKENGVMAKSQRGLALALQAKGYQTGVVKKVDGKTFKGVTNLGVL